MESESKTEPTRTVTFRISSKILEKLKDHANFENLTLNAVVNQLLSHAVNWDIAASKAGWVPIERSVLKGILNRLDEEDVIQIAKMAGNVIAKDLSLSMTGNFGIREWIEILRLRSKSAGFGFSQIEDKEFVTFVMRHHMGMRCSLHWKTFYEYGFKQLGCPVTLELTESAVVYKIPRKYLG